MSDYDGINELYKRFLAYRNGRSMQDLDTKERDYKDIVDPLVDKLYTIALRRIGPRFEEGDPGGKLMFLLSKPDGYFDPDRFVVAALRALKGDFIDKVVRKWKVPTVDTVAFAMNAAPEEECEVERSLDTLQAVARLHRAVTHALKGRDPKIVKTALMKFDGKSAPEIAEALDEPVTSVHMRTSRLFADIRTRYLELSVHEPEEAEHELQADLATILREKVSLSEIVSAYDLHVLQYQNLQDIPEAPSHFIPVYKVNSAINRATSPENNLQMKLFLSEQLLLHPDKEIEIGSGKRPLKELIGYHRRGRNRCGMFCHPELASYICSELDIVPKYDATKWPDLVSVTHFDLHALHRGTSPEGRIEIEAFARNLLAGPPEIEIPLKGEKRKIKINDYVALLRPDWHQPAIFLHPDLRELAEQTLGIVPHISAEEKQKYIIKSDLIYALHHRTHGSGERWKSIHEFIETHKDEIVDKKSGLKASECIKAFRFHGMREPTAGKGQELIDRRIIPWLEYNYQSQRPEEGREFWKTGAPLLGHLHVSQGTLARQVIQPLLQGIREARRDEVITPGDPPLLVGDVIRRYAASGAGAVYYVDTRHLQELENAGIDLANMVRSKVQEEKAKPPPPRRSHAEQAGHHEERPEITDIGPG